MTSTLSHCSSSQSVIEAASRGLPASSPRPSEGVSRVISWMNVALTQEVGPTRYNSFGSRLNPQLDSLVLVSSHLWFSCALERHAGTREQPVISSGGQ